MTRASNRQRLHDLDDLLLGDGEGAHAGLRVDDVDAEPLEQGPGVADHRLLSTKPGARGSRPRNTFCGDGALGQEVELLEHRHEPRRPRLDGVA